MNIADKYKGLTTNEVEESRRKYGKNHIEPPIRDPWWKMYLETFEDPIIRLLLLAVVLSMIIAGYKFYTTGVFEWYEPIGVIIAIFLATYIGFINTWKAEKQFDILNKVNEDIPVIVIREGNTTKILKSEVVVGDIVILETGMEIPADAEILEAISLEVNESKLTGESVPVIKESKSKKNTKNDSAYPSWMALSSTIVVSGFAIVKVVAVGEKTEIGKTTTEALEENEEASPLQKQLDDTAQAIGVIAFSVAGILFSLLVIKGYMNGEIKTDMSENIIIITAIVGGLVALIPVWVPVIYDFFELKGKEIEKPEWLENKKTFFLSVLGGVIVLGIGIGLASVISGNISIIISDKQFVTSIEVILGYFMIALTLIVVAVPEGLPMATTMGLAFSMKKMLQQNVLVKRMMASEAIGAVTVICTDKTGTLTMNEMKVTAHKFGINLNEFIAENIAINSTANLDRSSKPYKVVGNPTEGALISWLDESNKDYGEYRSKFKIECQIPFTTENKYMTTAGLSGVLKKHIISVKGAPEKIMEYTKFELTGKKDENNFLIEEISVKRKTEILKNITEYQNRGMRVLGFAYEEVENGSACLIEKISPNLIWLGYVVIEDPIRREVPNAIETCRKAGIDVKIITGDNPQTAGEIGNQARIEEGKLDPKHLMTSDEFNKLSGDELNRKISELKVLARAKPQDKMTIVSKLKEQGHVVAMTGDGTNDAPAMNFSDCGIAMGKSGTATAKEASDLILMDDSFSSIVTGVLWGRTIYINIQRFILFQLTVNFTAILIAILGPFIGVQLPLTVIQMLWVNLIMDTFAALALATEPPHKSVMENKPRNPSDFIITKAMWKNIISMGTVFVIVLIGMIMYFNKDGMDIKELTIIFSTFVMLQMWNLFNARVFMKNESAFRGLLSNKMFLMITLAIFIGQIIMVQFGGKIFRTSPLSINEWLGIIISTSLVMVLPALFRKFNSDSVNLK